MNSHYPQKCDSAYKLTTFTHLLLCTLIFHFCFVPIFLPLSLAPVSPTFVFTPFLSPLFDNFLPYFHSHPFLRYPLSLPSFLPSLSLFRTPLYVLLCFTLHPHPSLSNYLLFLQSLPNCFHFSSSLPRPFFSFSPTSFLPSCIHFSPATTPAPLSLFKSPFASSLTSLSIISPIV